MPAVFDENNPDFAAERAELRAMLSEPDYAAARLTTLNAHYTDFALVGPVWDAVQKLGITRGEVLEPGCGSGNFIGLAPEPMYVTGVERDPTTAAVAAALYPEATVIPASFADLVLAAPDDDPTAAPETDPGEGFDAVVGNVPFGRLRLHDPEHNPDLFSIHNHFIVKSLRLTRPGGVVALLTSRWTLDAGDPQARDAIGELAELITAVRLPTGAHQRAAGTAVVTDLLVLRRRAVDASAETEPAATLGWREVTELEMRDAQGAPQKIAVNQYFSRHPDHILGTLRLGHGQFTDQDLIVQAHDGNDLANALSTVLTADCTTARVQRGAIPPPAGQRSRPRLTQRLRNDAEDTLAFADHDAARSDKAPAFVQLSGGRWLPYAPPKDQASELAALLRVRDTLQELLTAETATCPPPARTAGGNDASTADLDTATVSEADVARLRADLNTHYDAYTEQYGPLCRFTWREAKTPGWNVYNRWCREHERQPRPASDGTVLRFLREMAEAGCGRKRLTDYLDAIVKRHRDHHMPLSDELVQDATAVIARSGEADYELLDLDQLGLRHRTKQVPRQGGFRIDPSAARVYALEDYDPATGTATKDAIFRHRVIAPITPREHADSPSDAISLCLNRCGRLDLDVIAELLGLPGTDDAREALGDLIFTDPTTKRILLRNDYLSGNVRAKLVAAEAAAEQDPGYREHVAALREAVPETLGPEQITVQLGSWIDVSYVQQYIRELLHDDQVRVEHPSSGIWTVTGGATETGLARAEWGTSHRCAQELLEANLAKRPIKVTYSVEGVVFTDVPATTAAKAKAEAIADRFRSWVWEDGDRARDLVKTYNDLFNAEIPRSYDDLNLTTPGLNPEMELQPHQRTAVAAQIFNPSFGLFHEVGAGKTLEVIVGAMECRRLGLARRQVVLIPNHLIEQFHAEWLRAYPQAKVLAASTDDLGGDNRRRLVRRILTGDYDAIIMTRGAFRALPVTSETESVYHSAACEEISAALDAAEFNELPERTVKQLEEAKAQAEETLKTRLAKIPRDRGICWEDLDIDKLYIDEAQDYKNDRRFSALPDTAHPGSLRAIDLDMKLAHIAARHGHERVVMSTATPWTNSLAEIHTVLRRLGAGVGALDPFLHTFGEMITTQEMVPGGGFKDKDRLRRLVNVPELYRMIRLCADIRTADDLNLATPTVHSRVIKVPATEQLRGFNARLGRRYADLPRRPQKGDPNHLSLLTEGIAAALDLRLVGERTDEPQKVDILADLIVTRWQDHRETRYLDRAGNPSPRPGALQLVFCSLSTPKPSWNFYDELRELLVSAGMPRDAIRFIHEANTDQKTAELYAAARDGRIAVLIGSAEKMGTGVNVQDRAIGLYRVSPPWRPDIPHQELGRVERKYNQNTEVFADTLVSAPSLDAKRWEVVRQKWDAFRPLMTGQFTGRIIDVPDDDSDYYGEVMATAAGDVRIKRRMALEREVGKLRSGRESWARTQASYRMDVDEADRQVPIDRAAIAELDQVIANRVDTAGDAFALRAAATTYTSRIEAAAYVSDAIERLIETGSGGQSISLGKLGGQTVQATISGDLKFATLHLAEVPESKSWIRSIDLPVSHRSIVRLENLIVNAEETRRSLFESIERLERDAAWKRPLIGEPFEQQDKLDEAEKKLKEIKIELGAAKRQRSESGSERAELADSPKTSQSLETQQVPAEHQQAQPEDDRNQGNEGPNSKTPTEGGGPDHSSPLPHSTGSDTGSPRPAEETPTDERGPAAQEPAIQGEADISPESMADAQDWSARGSHGTISSNAAADDDPEQRNAIADVNNEARESMRDLSFADVNAAAEELRNTESGAGVHENNSSTPASPTLGVERILSLHYSFAHGVQLLHTDRTDNIGDRVLRNLRAGWKFRTVDRPDGTRGGAWLLPKTWKVDRDEGKMRDFHQRLVYRLTDAARALTRAGFSVEFDLYDIPDVTRERFARWHQINPMNNAERAERLARTQRVLHALHDTDQAGQLWEHLDNPESLALLTDNFIAEHHDERWTPDKARAYTLGALSDVIGRYRVDAETREGDRRISAGMREALRYTDYLLNHHEDNDSAAVTSLLGHVEENSAPELVGYLAATATALRDRVAQGGPFARTWMATGAIALASNLIGASHHLANDIGIELPKEHPARESASLVLGPHRPIKEWDLARALGIAKVPGVVSRALLASWPEARAQLLTRAPSTRYGATVVATLWQAAQGLLPLEDARTIIGRVLDSDGGLIDAERDDGAHPIPPVRLSDGEAAVPVDRIDVGLDGLLHVRATAADGSPVVFAVPPGTSLDRDTGVLTAPSGGHIEMLDVGSVSEPLRTTPTTDASTAVPQDQQPRPPSRENPDSTLDQEESRDADAVTADRQTEADAPTSSQAPARLDGPPPAASPSTTRQTTEPASDGAPSDNITEPPPSGADATAPESAPRSVNRVALTAPAAASGAQAADEDGSAPHQPRQATPATSGGTRDLHSSDDRAHGAASTPGPEPGHANLSTDGSGGEPRMHDGAAPHNQEAGPQEASVNDDTSSPEDDEPAEVDDQQPALGLLPVAEAVEVLVGMNVRTPADLLVEQVNPSADRYQLSGQSGYGGNRTLDVATDDWFDMHSRQFVTDRQARELLARWSELHALATSHGFQVTQVLPSRNAGYQPDTRTIALHSQKTAAARVRKLADLLTTLIPPHANKSAPASATAGEDVTAAQSKSERQSSSRGRGRGDPPPLTLDLFGTAGPASDETEPRPAAAEAAARLTATDDATATEATPVDTTDAPSHSPRIAGSDATRESESRTSNTGNDTEAGDGDVVDQAADESAAGDDESDWSADHGLPVVDGIDAEHPIEPHRWGWTLFEEEPGEIAFAQAWMRHDVSLCLWFDLEDRLLATVPVLDESTHPDSEWIERDLGSGTTRTHIETLLAELGRWGVATPTRDPHRWTIRQILDPHDLGVLTNDQVRPSDAPMPDEGTIRARFGPHARLVNRDEDGWRTSDGKMVEAAEYVGVPRITKRNQLINYILRDNNTSKQLGNWAKVVVSGRARDGLRPREALGALRAADREAARRALTAAAGRGSSAATFDFARARAALHRLANGDPTLPVNTQDQLIIEPGTGQPAKVAAIHVGDDATLTLAVDRQTNAGDADNASQENSRHLIPVAADATLYPASTVIEAVSLTSQTQAHAAAETSHPNSTVSASPTSDEEPEQGNETAEPSQPSAEAPQDREDAEHLNGTPTNVPAAGPSAFALQDTPGLTGREGPEPDPLTDDDIACGIRRLGSDGLLHLLRTAAAGKPSSPHEYSGWFGDGEQGLMRARGLELRIEDTNPAREGRVTWKMLARWIKPGLDSPAAPILARAERAQSRYRNARERFAVRGENRRATTAMQELEDLTKAALEQVLNHALDAHRCGSAPSPKARGGDQIPAIDSLLSRPLDERHANCAARIDALTSVLPEPQDDRAVAATDLQPGDVLRHAGYGFALFQVEGKPTADSELTTVRGRLFYDYDANSQPAGRPFTFQTAAETVTVLALPSSLVGIVNAPGDREAIEVRGPQRPQRTDSEIETADRGSETGQVRADPDSAENAPHTEELGSGAQLAPADDAEPELAEPELAEPEAERTPAPRRHPADEDIADALRAIPPDLRELFVAAAHEQPWRPRPEHTIEGREWNVGNAVAESRFVRASAAGLELHNASAEVQTSLGAVSWARLVDWLRPGIDSGATAVLVRAGNGLDAFALFSDEFAVIEEAELAATATQELTQILQDTERTVIDAALHAHFHGANPSGGPQQPSSGADRTPTYEQQLARIEALTSVLPTDSKARLVPAGQLRVGDLVAHYRQGQAPMRIDRPPVERDDHVLLRGTLFGGAEPQPVEWPVYRANPADLMIGALPLPSSLRTILADRADMTTSPRHDALAPEQTAAAVDSTASPAAAIAELDRTGTQPRPQSTSTSPTDSTVPTTTADEEAVPSEAPRSDHDPAEPDPTSAIRDDESFVEAEPRDSVIDVAREWSRLRGEASEYGYSVVTIWSGEPGIDHDARVLRVAPNPVGTQRIADLQMLLDTVRKAADGTHPKPAAASRPAPERADTATTSAPSPVPSDASCTSAVPDADQAPVDEQNSSTGGSLSPQGQPSPRETESATPGVPTAEHTAPVSTHEPVQTPATGQGHSTARHRASVPSHPTEQMSPPTSPTTEQSAFPAALLDAEGCPPANPSARTGAEPPSATGGGTTGEARPELPAAPLDAETPPAFPSGLLDAELPVSASSPTTDRTSVASPTNTTAPVEPDGESPVHDALVAEYRARGIDYPATMSTPFSTATTTGGLATVTRLPVRDDLPARRRRSDRNRIGQWWSRHR